MFNMSEVIAKLLGIAATLAAPRAGESPAFPLIQQFCNWLESDIEGFNYEILKPVKQIEGQGDKPIFLS